MKFNLRQHETIQFLSKRTLIASIQEIQDYLFNKDLVFTKVTLNRDLSDLIANGMLEKLGQGRNTKYKLKTRYKLFQEINFAEYFSINSDDRKVQEAFNIGIFDDLLYLFSQEEIEQYDQLNERYRSNIENSSTGIVRKELERLIIDFSWKSSQMEGNTYNLLETEKLIKTKEETRGHSKEEASMILNHKKALDYILENKEDFKVLDSEKIILIHSMVVLDLDIETGFRVKRVGVGATKYKPLSKFEEIEAAVDKLCSLVNQIEYPLVKALILIAMISYIQAFEDGNKRTARILSTAILLAYDFCPISYRVVDQYDYKKALLLFYEQNNISILKRLFLDQFEFSVGEYF